MLDFYKVTAGLSDVMRQMKHDSDELGQGLEELEDVFRNVVEQPTLLEEQLKLRWTDQNLLLARPLEPFSTVRQIPPRPREVELVAVDGSQSLSPFLGLAWFLVNLGVVRLRLGPNANYDIKSLPRLVNIDRNGREDVPRPEVQMVRHRAVMEVEELAKEAEGSQAKVYTLALADGGLTYWYFMQGRRDKGAQRTLEEMVAILPRFRNKKVALAGYLSGSANKEVVNTLSSMLDKPPLQIPDRVFWMQRLKPGERGPILVSNSDVLGKYPTEEDRPVFFPLRVSDEVARVEIPAWCIPQADVIAAVLLDQAGKGGGYPQILTEAHQAAVVSAREAEAFWQFLAGQMEQEGLHLRIRPKDSSKRFAGI